MSTLEEKEDVVIKQQTQTIGIGEPYRRKGYKNDKSRNSSTNLRPSKSESDDNFSNRNIPNSDLITPKSQLNDEKLMFDNSQQLDKVLTEKFDLSSTNEKIKSLRSVAINESQKTSNYSNEGIWTTFNKYLYTVVLLFMATLHFNLLGFLFFVLFIIHSLAYYAFRVSDSQIDYFMVIKRDKMVDIRQFFAYCFLFVSVVALLGIVTMKIILHFSGQDQNPFDLATETTKEDENASDFFSFLQLLIPDFDSVYTLVSVVVTFGFSLVFLWTRQQEIQEIHNKDCTTKMNLREYNFASVEEKCLTSNESRDGDSYQGQSDDNSSKSAREQLNTANFEMLESHERLQKRKAQQIKVGNEINDYHFRYSVTKGLSFILLGVIAAANLSWINGIYQLIFTIHALLIGLHYKQASVNFWSMINSFVVIILIFELTAQYGYYIRSSYLQLSMRQKYQREVVGLLHNTTSFIVFAIKVKYLLIECTRMQYRLHLDNLSFIPEVKKIIEDITKKNPSLLAKLLSPISQFMYIATALVYILLHPSALFVLFVPALIYSFFAKQKAKMESLSVYNISTKFFFVLALLYTTVLYGYHLYSLQKDNTLLAKWRSVQSQSYESTYLWEIFGLSEVSKTSKGMAMRYLFPFYYEWLFILTLAIFAKYQQISLDAQVDLVTQQPRLLRKRSPIAENISSPNSKKDNDEIKSERDTSMLQDASLNDQEDNTLRGWFVRKMTDLSSVLMLVWQNSLNFATIHSTKFALFLLFTVSAVQPNISNGVLFVMFLLLALANNTQTLQLWKATLIMLSFLICGQYSIRVFAANEFLLGLKQNKLTDPICLSGLFSCEDDQDLKQAYKNLELVNFKLYLPNYALLLTFVLAYFILTSENYSSLLQQYIDQELALKRKHKKALKQQRALRRSLNRQEQQSVHTVSHLNGNGKHGSILRPTDPQPESLNYTYSEFNRTLNLHSQRHIEENRDLRLQMSPSASPDHPVARSMIDGHEENLPFIRNVNYEADEDDHISHSFDETISQLSSLQRQLRSSIVMCDPITKLFVQYALYLLIFAMALLSTTLPLSLINVILLVVMTIIVIMSLNSNSLVKLYQNSYTLLYILKMGALLSLIARYVAQFYLSYETYERIDDPRLIQSEQGKIFKFFELLLGFHSDFFFVRMLSLTLILVIANLQLNTINNQMMMEILADCDRVTVDRTVKSTKCNMAMTYLIFALYQTLPVGLLLVIFFTVAREPSLLGLIAMLSTIIILHRHASSYWKDSYIVIGKLAQVFVLFTYTCDFVILALVDHIPELNPENQTDNFFLNALHSNLEYFKSDQKFFTKIFWIYVILAFCFIQKRISLYESYFELTVPEPPEISDIGSEKAEKLSEQNRNHNGENIQGEDARSVSFRNEECELLRNPVTPTNVDCEKNQNKQLQNSSAISLDELNEAQARKEEIYRQAAIYQYEEAIRNCLWFKAEVNDVFLFTHGTTVTLMLCFITIFVKANVTSILYIVAFYKIYKVQYYPSRYLSCLNSEANITKRTLINSSLGYLIMLTSILISLEYCLITLFDFSKEDSTQLQLDIVINWKYFVETKLCYLKGDDENLACFADWNNWLELGKGSIQVSFFMIQYFLLMSAYYTRTFTSKDIEQVKLRIRNEPKYGDENDFTQSQESIKQNTDQEQVVQQAFIEKLIQLYFKLERLSDYTVFQLFPYLLVFVIIVSLVRFDGKSFLTLIEIGFLMHALFILTYFKSFYTKSDKLINYFRVYNFIVMVILVVFQAPIFVCPYLNVDKNGVNSYVPANQCQRFEYEARGQQSENFYSVYSALTQSIGLKKYLSSSMFPLAYLFILLFTEVQAWAFSHPYYRAYVLQSVKNQKLDSRMRAFIQVENFHLNRKWSYKAIKQQIKILHARLIRIMNEYEVQLERTEQGRRQWYLEDDHHFDETQGLTDKSVGSDLEQPQLHSQTAIKEEVKQEVGETSGVEDKSGNLKALRQMMEEKWFIEHLEETTLALLKPNLPVISFKNLHMAVKKQIIDRANSFLKLKEQENIKDKDKYKIDQEDLRELLDSLITPLQKAIYYSDKISLYHKKGIGLNLALKDSCFKNLKNSDDAFYANMFLPKEQTKLDNETEKSVSLDKDQEVESDRASKYSDKEIQEIMQERLSHAQNENRSVKSEQNLHDQNLIQETEFPTDYDLHRSLQRYQSSKSSYSELLGSSYDIDYNSIIRQRVDLSEKENAEHAIDGNDLAADPATINQNWKEELECMKNTVNEDLPLSFRLSLWLRSIILENYTDKSIFFSLYDKERILKNDMNLFHIPFTNLLNAMIYSQSENIMFALFFMNFAMNANLLSLVLPLSALFYALLETPNPSHQYWNFVTKYLLVVVSMKLAIQIPIFCSSPVFSFFECSGEQVEPAQLVNRIDFIVGLQKFSGPASYPQDIGIFFGIIWELLMISCICLLKSYLVMSGRWHYVRTDPDIQQTPKFKAKYEQISDREKANLFAKKTFYEKEYQNYSQLQKLIYNISSTKENMKNFFLKLQPRYMSKIQPNQDLRKEDQNPVIMFNANKVKPGNDYFSGNFFSLMIILVMTLIQYRSIMGIQETGDDPTGLNLDHFTISQVLLLFGLMLLMLVERMLYRTRKNSHWISDGGVLENQQEGFDFAKHALTAKMVIYGVLVLSQHFYLGFILPIQQGIKLSRNSKLLLYYLLWVIHFVFAALQIRDGYPQAPYKQTFMRDTSWIKVTLFRIYKALPFIWEMKVIIDWTVTNTCLDLFQWFRLDDAFVYVFYNKYQSDARSQRREYESRGWFEKFTQGFCFALGIITLILAPILLFSGINPTLIDNPVKSGHIELMFELNNSGNEYEIFYSQAFNIRGLNRDEQSLFNEYFSPTDSEVKLQNFQRSQFTPYSQQNWVISNPSLERLVRDFNANENNENSTFKLKSQWTFIREQPAGKESTKGEQIVEIPLSKIKPYIDVIEGDFKNGTLSASIKIEDIFPKFLRLSQQSKTSLLDLNVKSQKDGKKTDLSMTVDLYLFRSTDGTFYWKFDVASSESDDMKLFTLKEDQAQDQDLVLLIYNEKVMGSVLTSFAQYSVIGIYVTIVYAVGSFLRIIFDRYSERVIYEELPNTEKLLEICEGIFIAQLEGDLKREKRLYDLLIIVYRSPELMIKMTGIKQQYLPELEQQAHNQNQDNQYDTVNNK